MNHPVTSDTNEQARASRRRALKTVGAAALAVPVIETLTGKDLLNISAQAQSGQPNFIAGSSPGVDGQLSH